jgi:hypothetical protein
MPQSRPAKGTSMRFAFYLLDIISSRTAPKAGGTTANVTGLLVPPNVVTMILGAADDLIRVAILLALISSLTGDYARQSR